MLTSPQNSTILGTGTSSLKHQGLSQRWIYITSAVGTGSSLTGLVAQIDPEETLLSNLRRADQAAKRAEARARIARKRTLNPIEGLLALLERPEYRIEVSDEVLREILSEYPEDVE